ncbi:RING-H2 finger protein ATL66 [Cucumis melo var. makuwa]|uniref:RING-H2 finger protein ATL66 n=1 Tax=Cucumis melo var. makuwa TaxID=1194695 RepID=A0A5D3BUB8_CUCMM|nr:RING-H2 finger protein ATL66 [Cucumis melo var. makuwa]TYK02578.1 RING-H2 finger protein ATL66 [Cucumis melo var. makuwa]
MRRTFVDVGSNVLSRYEGFPNEDGNDMEIPTVLKNFLTCPSRTSWAHDLVARVKAIAKWSNVQHQDASATHGKSLDSYRESLN